MIFQTSESYIWLSEAVFEVTGVEMDVLAESWDYHLEITDSNREGIIESSSPCRITYVVRYP